MEVIYLLIGLVIGAVVGALVAGLRAGRYTVRIATLEGAAQQREAAYRQEAEQREEAHRQAMQLREEAHRQALEQAQTQARETRQADARAWEQQFQAFRQELMRLHQEALSQREKSLQDTNRTQIDAILRPMRDTMSQFKNEVDQQRRENSSAKTELKTTFTEMMRQFGEIQDRSVKALGEQTQQLQKGADSLSRALRGSAKTQGNWGEMLLERLLEESGLRKGHEFERQYKVEDNKKSTLRYLDVLVHLPEGRDVVIDSKVSLTAYLRAAEANTEAERQQALKEHLDSVRRHVKELAEKRYPTMVPNSLEYVVMFVPVEGAYMTAIQADNNLVSWAFGQHVALASQTTLLTLMGMVGMMWRRAEQDKNAARILNLATKLYEKAAGLDASFLAIGDALGKAQKMYDRAAVQLYRGNGNLLKQIYGLRQLGVNSPKEIKSAQEEDDEESADNELLQE